MESITLTITEERIREALDKAIGVVLKSDYSNPVRDAVESAIKDKSGEIKKVIDSIIADAISNPEFKSRIADSVINRMVESALKTSR